MKYYNTKKYVRFKPSEPELIYFNKKYYFFTPEYFIEIVKPKIK